MSVGASSLYLYLLVRNDRLEQAATIANNMENLGVAEVDSFLNWFRAKYGLTLAAVPP